MRCCSSPPSRTLHPAGAQNNNGCCPWKKNFSKVIIMKITTVIQLLSAEITHHISINSPCQQAPHLIVRCIQMMCVSANLDACTVLRARISVCVGSERWQRKTVGVSWLNNSGCVTKRPVTSQGSEESCLGRDKFGSRAGPVMNYPSSGAFWLEFNKGINANLITSGACS